MLASGGYALSVLMAIAMSVVMIATATFIFFYHHRKHEDFEQWIDYAFSVETLKQTLLYFRFIAIAMVVVLALFVVNLLWLQADGFQTFASGRHGVIASTFFALDLVLRGAFFDVMEHWELYLTPLRMNRDLFWFVVYCFIFRIFFALVLLRILVSFAWLWPKMKRARQRSHHIDEPTP
ncbi:MAG: hypothetical protein AAFR04_01215 [Pseudomonadota bacterium]